MEFYDKIANISFDQFNKLPKTGKPTKDQWTILSTIVQEVSDCSKIEVVSLGTGTKCIGENKMSLKGDILNDSHAEIICRRSFLLYIYTQIKLCLNKELSIFKLNETNTKFKLSDNIIFHFFTTQIPCGDAAIFPKSNDDFGEPLSLLDNFENPTKKRKLNQEDIHRTGAKCLKDSLQDPHLAGAMYHNTSIIRTKPGRGDPTLSVSCSDKITRWSYLGLQGALLSIILEKPIYLKSITLAGGIPFSKESLTRAFNTRFSKNLTVSNVYKKTNLIINQAKPKFEFRKFKENQQPCPSSISWYKNNLHMNKPEVAVEGLKQGVTKKKIGTKQARLQITKVELFRQFNDVVKIMKLDGFTEALTYGEIKLKACDYQRVWGEVKHDIFKIWTVKDPIFSNFYLD